MSDIFGIAWTKAAAIYAWLASWIGGYPKTALAAILILAAAALL